MRYSRSRMYHVPRTQGRIQKSSWKTTNYEKAMHEFQLFLLPKWSVSFNSIFHKFLEAPCSLNRFFLINLNFGGMLEYLCKCYWLNTPILKIKNPECFKFWNFLSFRLAPHRSFTCTGRAQNPVPFPFSPQHLEIAPENQGSTCRGSITRLASEELHKFSLGYIGITDPKAMSASSSCLYSSVWQSSGDEKSHPCPCGVSVALTGHLEPHEALVSSSVKWTPCLFTLSLRVASTSYLLGSLLSLTLSVQEPWQIENKNQCLTDEETEVDSS